MLVMDRAKAMNQSKDAAEESCEDTIDATKDTRERSKEVTSFACIVIGVMDCSAWRIIMMSLIAA